MDATFILQIGVMVVLLLLVAFMMVIVVKSSSTPEQKAKHKAKGHSCKECLFCKESKCVYFHEDSIDVERPACMHYEEKEEYRPA